MKRIVQLGGMLIALGMLFASCQMETSDSSVSGYSAGSGSSNINGITIGIKSIVNTERTILPVDWDDTHAEALVYVFQTQETGTTGWKTIKTFSYKELKEKTATVDIERKIWDLKLIGYIPASDSSETTPKADTDKGCLIGLLENQNFTTGMEAVTFDLKAYTNTTAATGSINVSIAWVTSKAKRLEFGIYDTDKSTEDIVKDKGRNAVINDKDDSPAPLKEILTAFSGSDPYSTNWSAEKVPAGMYKFAAVFYDNDDDTAFTGNVIGYYIDYLYVDGGNLSKATVNYGDKFNTTPENPTWLAVETYFEPIKGDEDTPAEDYEHYYAKFHWNDISTNEDGFELVINDGTNDIPLNSETLTGSGLYTSSWYNGTAIETLSKNALDAGSTWVVLKLETGKKYTAKIRAINKYTPAYYIPDTPTPTPNPDAKFCENLNRNGDGKGRSYAPIVTDGTGTTAKKQFGMFVVNYKLDGASVTEEGKSPTNPSATKNYIVGKNYHSEEQDLMTDNTLVYPYISKTGYVFDHWQTTAGDPKTPVNAIGTKNINELDLEPVWSGADVLVSVTFPSYADAQDVKIAADRNIDNTVTFNVLKESSITISAGANLSVTAASFVLTDANGKAVTDDGITVSGQDWTWTPTPSALPTGGYYCLQITGTYNDKAGSGRENMTLCGNVYIKVEN